MLAANNQIGMLDILTPRTNCYCLDRKVADLPLHEHVCVGAGLGQAAHQELVAPGRQEAGFEGRYGGHY